MDWTETARETFSADEYAIKTTGVKIEKVEPGYCLCSLAVDQRHLNNNGDVMGGALFTLADYAFGTAANIGGKPTVTLSCTINFMRATRGPLLYAEAKKQKVGRNISFFEVNITEADGKLVAVMQASGFSGAQANSKGGA
ncbi:MAG: PaaI family thioesterase [Oscillospiraceae bacterium]|jgi:acyl-CoA thioesterase